jgi:hypothetical protein
MCIRKGTEGSNPSLSAIFSRPCRHAAAMGIRAVADRRYSSYAPRWPDARHRIARRRPDALLSALRETSGLAERAARTYPAPDCGRPSCTWRQVAARSEWVAAAKITHPDANLSSPGARSACSRPRAHAFHEPTGSAREHAFGEDRGAGAKRRARELGHQEIGNRVYLKGYRGVESLPPQFDGPGREGPCGPPSEQNAEAVRRQFALPLLLGAGLSIPRIDRECRRPAAGGSSHGEPATVNQPR